MGIADAAFVVVVTSTVVVDSSVVDRTSAAEIADLAFVAFVAAASIVAVVTTVAVVAASLVVFVAVVGELGCRCVGSDTLCCLQLFISQIFRQVRLQTHHLVHRLQTHS